LPPIQVKELASSGAGRRSILVGRTSRADRVEAVLRRADATVETWFRRAAGAIRKPVDGLQAGLKHLSTGLEQVEKDPKPTTKTRRARPATSKQPTTRPRKTKKAA
jgi:hypothetical protein